MKTISFKWFIIILSVVLTMLSAAVLLYVADSIAKYDENQLDNYMDNFINNLKDRNYVIALTGTENVTKSEFDRADASIRNGLAYLAENDSLTFVRIDSGNDNDKPVFDLYDGNNPLIRVTLYAKEHTERLGLFSFNVWDVEEVVVISNNGLFDYEISVPNNCTVAVNGRKLTEEESSDSIMLAGLPEISKKMGLTYQVHYAIKGLTDALDFQVTDTNGKPVQCERTGTRCFKPLDFEKTDNEATARTKIKDYPDILAMVRAWSLFISRDQHGGRHGFDNIKDLLIEGTYLYIYALRYAESIDITYVSNHGLDKDTFTNARVCNFEIYSDRDFSCDVYMNKNLRVHGILTEKIAERIHFAFYDDTNDGKDNPSWRIVSMKSLPKLQ